MAENLSDVTTKPDSKVIYPHTSPRSNTGGLIILKGNLAPEGAVFKVAGTSMSSMKAQQKYITVREKHLMQLLLVKL